MNILFVTHRGMERLSSAFLELLHSNWSEHPQVTVVTDGGNFGNYKCVRTNDSNWVTSMVVALEMLIAQRELDPHVMIILDDLVPLWAVDCDVLKKNLEIMQNEGWGKLSFFIDEPKSPPLEILHLEGSHFFRIPHPGSGADALAFPWYNSLQVSIWRSDYLLQVCQLSLRLGITDPWKFEHIHAPENHFVSAYRWPAVFQGLHYLKNVNLKAVRGINGCHKIKTQLYLAYIAKLPSQLRWKLSLKMKRLRARFLQKA
jgi:hypothetical protein